MTAAPDARRVAACRPAGWCRRRCRSRRLVRSDDHIAGWYAGLRGGVHLHCPHRPLRVAARTSIGARIAISPTTRLKSPCSRWDTASPTPWLTASAAEPLGSTTLVFPEGYTCVSTIRFNAPPDCTGDLIGFLRTGRKATAHSPSPSTACRPCHLRTPSTRFSSRVFRPTPHRSAWIDRLG